MRDIVAGCCQLAIKPANVQANLSKAEGMLNELAKRNCRIAVLPEMWSCSFPYPVLCEMAGETPAVLERLRHLAKSLNMAIVGSLPEAEERKIYNTDYLIDTTGEITGTYRKVHLFSLYGEHKKFGRGESAKVFETTLGKIGLMICYDLRFPEFSRKMALEGAEILCVSSLWPFIRIENWSVLLRARAIENQLFVIGCNGCGTEEKITWGGGSAIVSALGTVVAQAGTDEQIIAGVLDTGEMEEFRKLIPCFQDRVHGAYEERKDFHHENREEHEY